MSQPPLHRLNRRIELTASAYPSIATVGDAATVIGGQHWWELRECYLSHCNGQGRNRALVQ